MKINGNIRVVKSPSGTEVFVQSADPVTNFVMHLPADAAIKDGDSVEFVQAPAPKPLTEEEAKKRATELPGQIAPAAG